jgi:hypothetical protein
MYIYIYIYIDIYIYIYIYIYILVYNNLNSLDMAAFRVVSRPVERYWASTVECPIPKDGDVYETCWYKYMHIYLYLYINIYMYFNIYLYIHIHKYTYAIHIYIYVPMNTFHRFKDGDKYVQGGCDESRGVRVDHVGVCEGGH